MCKVQSDTTCNPFQVFVFVDGASSDLCNFQMRHSVVLRRLIIRVKYSQTQLAITSCV